MIIASPNPTNSRRHRYRQDRKCKTNPGISRFDMESLRIYVTNTRLEELGIDQEDEEADFFFRSKDLIGYWIVKDDDGIPSDIMFYVGAGKFVTKYSKDNIDKLYRILNL